MAEKPTHRFRWQIICLVATSVIALPAVAFNLVIKANTSSTERITPELADLGYYLVFLLAVPFGYLVYALFERSKPVLEEQWKRRFDAGGQRTPQEKARRLRRRRIHPFLPGFKRRVDGGKRWKAPLFESVFRIERQLFDRPRAAQRTTGAVLILLFLWMTIRLRERR